MYLNQEITREAKIVFFNRETIKSGLSNQCLRQQFLLSSGGRLFVMIVTHQGSFTDLWMERHIDMKIIFAEENYSCLSHKAHDNL